MKFLVRFDGRYLVKAPYWDSGKWTDNEKEATEWTEYAFFRENYPQYELVPR